MMDMAKFRKEMAEAKAKRGAQPAKTAPKAVKAPKGNNTRVMQLNGTVWQNKADSVVISKTKRGYEVDVNNKYGTTYTSAKAVRDWLTKNGFTFVGME